jgi:hypothetical protein
MILGRSAFAWAFVVGAALPPSMLGCAANAISFSPDPGSGGSTSMPGGGAGGTAAGVGGTVELPYEAGDCDSRDPDAGPAPDARNRCADAGAFDPDADIIVEVPEVSMSDLSVSTSECPRSVTLSATVVNDSPFGLTVPVAFYHSASMILIGVVEAPLVGGENGPELWPVHLVWENPPFQTELVTVVADDDGAGCSTIHEHNESDNVVAAALAICPSP